MQYLIKFNDLPMILMNHCDCCMHIVYEMNNLHDIVI